MIRALSIAVILLGMQGVLMAGTLTIGSQIFSIIANAPAVYEAIVHPVRSAKKVGGATVSTVKKIAHPKKAKKT